MKPTPHIPITEGLVYEALGEAGGIEEFLHRTAQPAPAASRHGVAAPPAPRADRAHRNTASKVRHS
jgi:hypothetical protein